MTAWLEGSFGRLEPVPGVPGLSLSLSVSRHVSTTSGTLSRVISSSLFIYPGHAKSVAAYCERVRGDYLEGLQRSVEGMRFFPGWTYRLYVDHSVYGTDVPTWHPQVVTLVSEVRARLWALRGRVELVLVRYERAGYRVGQTFLPSVWRFLPMVDASVDAFTCVDLDNPPSSLSAHFMAEWAEAPTNAASRLLFLFPAGYLPRQCAAYAATHLRRTMGSRAPGGHADRVELRCPNAQHWFGKRRSGSSDPIMPASVMADMLALAADQPLRRFFAALDMPLLLSIGRAVARSALLRESQSQSQSLGDALAHLRTALLRQLRQQRETESSSGFGGRRRRLRAAIEGEDRVADMATMLVFGQVVTAAAANATESVRRMLRAVDQALTADETGVTAVESVASLLGYGIDEYVLSAAMEQAPGVDMWAASTPAAGVQVNAHVQAHAGSAVPFLSWLTLLAHLGRKQRQPLLRDLYAEYAARAALFVRLVRHTWPDAEAIYSTRLVGLMGVGLTGRVGQVVRARFRSDLVEDEGWYRATVRRVVHIPSPGSTDRWLRPRGAGFDVASWAFVATTATGASLVKDIALRALFLHAGMLHLEKVSKDAATVGMGW